MPHALVVGAGIAGLASAIALQRAGWSVEIVDRAPALEPLGAALSLWPNAMAALRQLGAAEMVERRAGAIRRMRLETVAGVRLVDRAITDGRLPTRPALQGVLHELVGDSMVTLGREAVTLDTEAGLVGFADGSDARADLVVVADGIHSTLARAVTRTEVHYCGYTGVVALSDTVAPDGHEGIAAEYWGRHERFGLFDLGNGRRYWFYMATAAEDVEFGDLTVEASRLPPAVAAAVVATPMPTRHRWPIHAKPPPHRVACGRAVCVGDAAHAMEPNLGQGACQAIEDAVALGVVARTRRPEDLGAAFEAMRLDRIRRIVARAAEGGRAVHGSLPVQIAMRLGLRVMPVAVKERMIGGIQRLPDYR